jgi:hypothetical protein
VGRTISTTQATAAKWQMSLKERFSVDNGAPNAYHQIMAQTLEVGSYEIMVYGESKHKSPVPYHPQSNITERVNRT